MSFIRFCIFVSSAVLSVTGSLAGLKQEVYERGRLADARPRRDLRELLAPSSGLPGDEEYGGRVGPLSKRPFGSLFNMKSLGRRSKITEEEEEIIPEEDNEIAEKRYRGVLGGGYKFGKRGNLGHILGGGYTFGKREPNTLARRDNGQKRRLFGGLLGGGYKLGKRGFGSILGGGYKFGKRELGSILGGGYKFGKRSGDEDDVIDSEDLYNNNNNVEVNKRPWGNLFGSGFSFGKRGQSSDANMMQDIYTALLARKLASTPGFGESPNDSGRVMKGAISIAKKLFGNVLSNGYKLG